MNTRATFAVALSVLVLLSGAGLVVGVGEHAERTQQTSGGLDAAQGPASAEQSPENVEQPSENVAQDYEVTIDNVTINTWLLRNSTVRNATVQEVVIKNATMPDGSRQNVTLQNVSVGEFVLERARLKNVTAEKLTVRNKSVLNVPGGNFFDPDVENRTIDRHWTRNKTVSGVVIDRLVIDAAIMEENASLGPQADSGEFAPQANGEADIEVQNGTVGEALVINGQANNWSVGSTSGVEGANAGGSNETDGSNSSDESGALSAAVIETEA